MEIADWRKRIDEIDAQLAELLCERSRCVIEIGKIKRRQNLPVYDPEREKEILARIMKDNRGPLESKALKRLFERILDESRRVERLASEDQINRGENGKSLGPFKP
ncbi:MAG: chorismate mutase [Acidobacteria bacterium]|nr:MAG: chorismate mutase [Acidobacteriota bacterium]